MNGLHTAFDEEELFLLEEAMWVFDLKESHHPVKDGFAVEVVHEGLEKVGVMVEVGDDLWWEEMILI